MDYFDLFEGQAAPFDVIPARVTDVLERSSGRVTSEALSGGDEDLRSPSIFGVVGDTSLRMGHCMVSPLAHPWLLFELAALFGLSVRRVEELLYGLVFVVAKSPPGGPPTGSLVAYRDLEALESAHGPRLDLRTGHFGLRALAWLWQLPECVARLERLERGETDDPHLASIAPAERAALVLAGRRVATRFGALGLAPANAFLDALPIPPLALRGLGAPADDRSTPERIVARAMNFERKRAMFDGDAAVAFQRATFARLTQEAVFDLFTAGVVRMIGFAGLAPNDLAKDFVVEHLSAVREGGDEAPNPRAPEDLMIWGRRMQRTVAFVGHFLKASRGQPRDLWCAVLRASGVAVSDGG